jgi:two-component system phosphate regulon sensor histidine kinase PhoR
MKYSPEGGKVIVRIRARGEECVLEIEDHGMGINAEEKSVLFDRFFRGSKAANMHIQGVGLGLSIVKRIVEGHGGVVGVQSEHGCGATFSMTLPIKRSTHTQAPSLEAGCVSQEAL